MKVLLTGYTGFIGSNLTKSLNTHTLLGVDLVENYSVSVHFDWDTLKNCHDIDYVIHLAGKAHDTKRGGVLRQAQQPEERKGDCMSGEKRRRGDWAVGIRIFSRNEKKQDDMWHRLLRDPGICAVVQD